MMGDDAPLIDRNPSDKWPKYSNSNLTNKHITPKNKNFRSSGYFTTSANLIKLYVGLAFISTPKSISQAGIYGAIIGFVYAVL